MADVLPSSVPRETRCVVFKDGVPWVPIYCANCGCDGGWIPEETKRFAFYLCEPCAESWSPLVGTMVEPDEVFWATVKAEQLERYGRELEGPELAEVLKDGNNVLAKLARSR